jgi:hypothetical protein
MTCDQAVFVEDRRDLFNCEVEGVAYRAGREAAERILKTYYVGQLLRSHLDDFRRLAEERCSVDEYPNVDPECGVLPTRAFQMFRKILDNLVGNSAEDFRFGLVHGIEGSDAAHALRLGNVDDFKEAADALLKEAMARSMADSARIPPL